VRRVVEVEWGQGLIRSWNTHGWIDLQRRVGDKVARLVGAAPGEVLVGDSTSVDLFKLSAAALELRPRRRAIVSERGNFPTDLYVLEGLARLLGRGHELRVAERGDLLSSVDDDVALVVLTQVDYRSGALWDLREATRAVHERGALVLWDLAHSAGALPVDLTVAEADLAVGCGYKFLNGGPGAPAFLFVARRLQEALRTPIQGWLGHAEPFAFEAGYRPAPGIDRFQGGTPPILSLAALDAALDLFADVDLEALRAKSVALGELFLERVESRCGGLGLELACPQNGAARGSQVSLRHREGYAVVQALIARGVIGDFRAPDVLYLRHVDVWDAVEHLAEVLETREWDRPEFRTRSKVT
jgi:kynureninase